MIEPSVEGQSDEDDLQAARITKELMDYGLEPSDLAFYMERIEAIFEEKMRLMLTRVMPGQSLDKVEAVALRVEELND